MTDTGRTIFGSGGAAQTVSLLGPAEFAWDGDEALTDTGIKLFDIPVGAVLVKAWIEVTNVWGTNGATQDATEVILWLVASTEAEFLDYNFQPVAKYDKFAKTVTNGLGDTIALTEGNLLISSAAATFSEPGMVGVWVAPANGTLTQGAARAFALIATSA